MLGSMRKALIATVVVGLGVAGVVVREPGDHSAAIAASSSGSSPCGAEAVVLEAVRARGRTSRGLDTGPAGCRSQWSSWADGADALDLDEAEAYDVVSRAMRTSDEGAMVRVDADLEETASSDGFRRGGQLVLRARLRPSAGGVVLESIESQPFGTSWVPFR